MNMEVKPMMYDVFGRGVASVARATAMAVALCLSVALIPAMAADEPPAPASAITPTPAATSNSEFDNSCAMSLASGQIVKTDCSVNWTAPDGKVYCFSTEASKEAFLKNPDENIQKAREFFLAKDLTKDNAAAPAASGQPTAAAAAKPSKEFTEEDVNKRVDEVIAERSKDGAFVFHDPKLDADLNLVFEQIKIVRGMEGYGWFANVIFHDKDEAKKQYAIDFWLKPEGDRLTLMDIRVQKGPKQEGDGWTMITRMPVAWWWLPVQEHPGDMEVTRGWQVMSAIHTYIATHKDANGHLGIKDDKTGETLPLDFVEIHQPVRHLKKEGEYFVCTDFRKPGSTDEYYDIDFWVNQKSGKLEVDNVKVHKVPVQEDGIWTQVPRYTFDGMDFDVTN
jgi:YHS domain-containing protein